MEYIEIFPENTITEWPDSYDEDGVHVYSLKIQKLPVVEGEKYTVEWDGVRYECVGYSPADSIILGDISFYDERENEGSGEPFAIWTYPDRDFAYVDTIVEGDHTVCVYQGTKPGTEEPTKFIDHALLVLGYRVGQMIRAMWLKKEPIGFLYGREAKEGETPTHTINGMKYVGAVLPNIESIYTSEVRNNFPYAFIYYNPGANGFYVLRCISEEPGVGSKSNLALYPYDPNNRGQVISTFWGEGEANSFGDPNEFIGASSKVTEGIIWTNFDLRYQGTNEVYFPKSPDPIPVYEKPKSESTYLTFASAIPFTIATYNEARNWNGELYYSTDTKNWSEWSGSAIVSAEHDGEQRIYMRGVGNDAITQPEHNSRWVLSGIDIACRGNIETLLDYQMVANGEHPSMADECYRYMFLNCSNLTQAPSLNAVELTTRCYYSMFEGCSGLTKIPALPATTLADDCYRYMFYNCTSLTQAPALPATTLAYRCYYCMFEGCTNLAQLPALPATRLPNECYRYMFYGCSSLKLSTDSNNEYTTPYRIPYEDASQEVEGNAIDSMFSETGGTFTGTPSINTTYYTSNTVV